MRKILVTNALPYANGDLHLGHMLGYIQSDIWVRFQKLQGNQCIFVCGSDTHGTPIMLKAKSLGITPEELVTKYSNRHLQDFTDFEINFDNYHSTHNSLNKEIVEDIYNKLNNKNLISKKAIAQAYDPEAKMFLPDRFVKGTCPKCKAEDQYGDSCEVCGATYDPTELINPRSVISGQSPIQKNSEHFFFDLPALEKNIKDWIESNTLLQPEVANKLAEWFEQGLQSWDISRDAPYFGFAIPGTNEQKFFYVWLDAPMGYIASFKDYCNKNNINFGDFWGDSSSESELYHFIGKDIIYFHALFWPAILSSTGYKTPTSVFANGFLTVNGKKMSKSRGTFIQARTYLDNLEPSYLRYYFASRLTSRIDDIDLNLEEFVTKSNSDIVGKVVNIASRCAGFIYKKFDATLSGEIFDPELESEFSKNHDAITQAFEKREFAHAVRLIMALADKANQFIDYHKPWQLAKEEGQEQKVHQVCSQGINMFKVLIAYLKPIIPSIVAEAERFLNIQFISWADAPKFLINHKIDKFKPLATRIEKEKVDKILEDTKKMFENEQAPQSKKEEPKLDIAAECTFDDFMKVDLRIAKITEASHVEGADKLLKLILDLGGVTKQVFAGIKSAYKPEDLIGKHTIMVANLAPRKMKFGMSEGMVLAAGDGKGIYILEPHEGAQPGMRVK
ncbi:methionine--tRNA ligase [Francisella tularensis]|uniref:Methionine--tRNA ligase n=8 Tax=Francisella tularensis TaxID=263 RepID=SYM_FRATF|nr:methionine--tRNA ligase [Francisella tularensis]A7NAE2.2 RecName: Full=Methionine--tRNA ligase; AltName: Full=Methionyl-tRNA synthetase; Short=MetRS [Francisella tularensis subsp. holarctica FTNF002-00]AFX70150.1 methionyl-tRNA ligase [Francisella tularensis subsp. holarctica F92]ABU60945.2 methionyl-tRNA synthetase [Francisella tularensis subsp. holarctica FTNF002-00]AJI68041.1 methionine--tRNA ligase [Francisella tularensis subsp. holarctica]AKO69180.1 methionine--tRNA ligase [Francisella